jgi:endonuclease/exonuclease/phosphatase family metal-dependent hydrolase
MKKLILISFLIINSFSVFADDISIMSYNVENLFDDKHDENKDDWEFVPKNTIGKNDFCAKESSRKRRETCLNSDWNEKKLKIKLEQISTVVKGKEPNLPDLLGIVEVENKNVSTLLAKQLGYTDFEITESPDKRGVDVVLFYKEGKNFKKVSRNELLVPTDYPTRNILEVRFLVSEKYYLTVFVNHWPSLQNPDSARVKAATVLKNRIDEIVKLNSNESIIAMGDFNTIDTCDPHPFKTVLLKDNFLFDVHDQSLNSPETSSEFKSKLGSGTYYFPPKDQWNMLDHFFINENLLKVKEAKILLPTYEIYSTDEMKHELKKKIDRDNEKGQKIILAPKKFSPFAETKEAAGFSDHFPIFVKLSFANPEIKKVEVLDKKKKSKKMKK